MLLRRFSLDFGAAVVPADVGDTLRRLNGPIRRGYSTGALIARFLRGPGGTGDTLFTGGYATLYAGARPVVIFHREVGRMTGHDTPKRVYIGCAGWSLTRSATPVPEQQGTQLERYASNFRAVEINSSFHRSHRRATYERWAESVPESFRFSV
jgi:hypothetical protein